MVRKKLNQIWEKLLRGNGTERMGPGVRPGPWFMPLPVTARLDVSVSTGTVRRYSASRVILAPAQPADRAGNTLNITLSTN